MDIITKLLILVIQRNMIQQVSTSGELSRSFILWDFLEAIKTFIRNIINVNRQLLIICIHISFHITI